MAFASRFGRVSHALVKEQLREKFAHVGRRIEMTSDAMRTASTVISTRLPTCVNFSRNYSMTKA